MSAALVESVREASQAQMRRVAAQKASTSGDLHGMIAYEHQQLYALDLPAILAALTEAESLRAQVAAGQAREVALREALARLDALYVSEHDPNVAARPMWLDSALSTPTDTAALRAMLEKAAGMGMSCGYSRCCSKLEAKSDADRNEIVDRVLGGS